MTLALIALASILGLAAIGSAVQKLRRAPSVVTAMHDVGVTDKQIPLLALLEIVGAIGLLAGMWIVQIGVAAAAGLTVYFLGAVVAHLHARSPLKDAAPPIVLTLLALTTTLLELAR